LAFTLLKAAAFVALMFLVGKRFIPWLLGRIAHTRSRELFILAVLVIALTTALGAAELFSVSLALGAFAAGAIISESPQSYQVGADVLPFREAFAILFFVSVGMLVNPIFLLEHLTEVLALTAIIVVGKAVITLLIGLVVPGQGLTFLVVAAGLSQIGEFSFIVGQAGLALGLLDRNQYSLILASALISITLNPLLFAMLPASEAWLKRIPALWNRLDRQSRHPAVAPDEKAEPVVVVGYGRVGSHLLQVLRSMEVPMVIIEADAQRVDELNAANIPTIYGDAANSEVLLHSGLERAQALVVTIPEEASAEMIVAAAHDANPKLPIIARASSEEGINRLSELGATFVIHPELEGGLEMVRHTLLQLDFPRREVDDYTETIRDKHYELLTEGGAQPLLRNILRAVGEIEISWLEVPEGSGVIGKTLAEAHLRDRTGASVVAMVHDRKLMANPKSSTVFGANDRLGVIGDAAQIKALEDLLASK
jgi:CPA2 family monovalent cation:H+ antiporter-2